MNGVAIRGTVPARVTGMSHQPGFVNPEALPTLPLH